MLKILYLTFFTAFSLLFWETAHANGVYMHGLEHLDDNLSEIAQGPQLLQCKAESKPENELFELANQCMKSICGEPESNRSMVYDNKPFLWNITSSFREKHNLKEIAEVESIIANEFSYGKKIVEQTVIAQKEGKIDADPKQVKADLEAFVKLVNNNDLKDEFYNDCLGMEEINDSFSMKIENFKEEIGEFSQNFLQKSPIVMSSRSKSFLENFFNNDLKYDFGIDEKKNLLQRFRDFGNRQKPISPTDQYKYIRESVAKGTLSNLSSLCSQSPLLHSDMMSYDQSKINISYFTSNFYLPSNSFVFAHEMAHALSASIRNGQLSTETKNHFLSKMKCVNSNYLIQQKVQNSPIPSFQEETYFSEEDMADYIAAKVVEKGSKSYCTILAHNYERTDYDGLDLQSSETPASNTLNHYLHSSAFTRVLRIAIYRNENLSLSCQKIIQKTKDQFRWNSCY